MSAADPYGYPQEAYYAPGWQPPRPRVEPVAVAALVTGVLGLGPVALVLGVVALVRLRRSDRRGRGLAVAGTVLGVLGTLAWAAVVTVLVATSIATRPLPAEIADARDAHAVQLVTGSCVAELPTGAEVDRVRVVPCAQDHLAQVITEYTFDDRTWPGAEAALDRTSAACSLTDQERADGLRLVAWAPTEHSWAGGDRTGLCLAVHPAPVTGSMLG
jgi:hypothetical protein